MYIYVFILIIFTVYVTAIYVYLCIFSLLFMMELIINIVLVLFYLLSLNPINHLFLSQVTFSMCLRVQLMVLALASSHLLMNVSEK